MANPDTIGTGGLVAALLGAVGWLAKRYDDSRKAEIAAMQKQCDERIADAQAEVLRVRATVADLRKSIDERAAKIERLAEVREIENRKLVAEIVALRQSAVRVAGGLNGTEHARAIRAAHPRRPGPGNGRAT